MNYFFCFLIFLKVQQQQQRSSVVASLVYYNNYEYTSAVKLNNYNSYYGNVNILRYSMPSDVAQAQWYFQVRASRGCPPTPVYIYLEYAGYPVIAPLNEKFPDNFDMNRLTRTFTVLTVPGVNSTSSAQSAQLNVSSPKSGYWYSSVFYLSKEKEKHASACSFYLASLTNIWINEDVTVISLNTPLPYTPETTSQSSSKMYKYLTTSHDPLQLDIQLTNELCTLNAYARQSALPITNSTDNKYDTHVTCTNSPTCSLSIQYPVKKTWYFVTIESNCEYMLNLTSTPHSNANIFKTTRILGSKPYVTKYYVNPSNTYYLDTNSTPNFLEYLFDHATIGGTLNLRITNRVSAARNVTNVTVFLNGCLMFNSIEQYEDCSHGYRLKQRSLLADSTSSQLSVAYPMSGNWYLALWQECTDSESQSSVECPQTYPVGATVQVSTDQCDNNYCGDYGTCNVVPIGTNLVSTCKCSNNYGGYACMALAGTWINSTYVSDNVGEVLFLTLSNLLFLFPVFLALDRRWYIEAVMYFYTMFFSIFYHACGASSYSFCIFNYNGLQLADYIGAYSAFVITVLFIADLDRYWQLFGYFVGLLVCIALSLYNRSNTAAFVIVIVLAGVITIGSWINVWWQTGELYPQKRQLIIYIPGLVLAITAVTLFLAIESGDNYWLTHSFWHMLIAVSIIFFMPKGEGEPLFKFIRELIFGESNGNSASSSSANSRQNNSRSNGYF